MVLRLTSRSPRCPRFLTPSPALLIADLTPTIGASEPHDFAVRKQTAFVSRAARVHRIPPRVRDVRTPLLSRPDTRISELIWVGGKQKYFCKTGLDTTSENQK